MINSKFPIDHLTEQRREREKIKEGIANTLKPEKIDKKYSRPAKNPEKQS